MALDNVQDREEFEGDPIKDLIQLKSEWSNFSGSLNTIVSAQDALVKLKSMKDYMSRYRDIKSEASKTLSGSKKEEFDRLKAEVSSLGYFEFDKDLLTPMENLERYSVQLKDISALGTSEKIALGLNIFNTVKSLQQKFTEIKNDDVSKRPFGYMKMIDSIIKLSWKDFAIGFIPSEYQNAFDTITSMQQVMDEVKKGEKDLQGAILEQAKNHVGTTGSQIISAAEQFLTPDKPKLSTYTKEGIQFSEMDIDRAQTLLGQQPEKLVQFLIEPLNLPDGVVKDTVTQTLRDIIGTPTGVYTRREVNSIVSKSYKKNTLLFGFKRDDKEIKITMHNGVDIKTATLSPVGGLSNPWNALAVVPGAMEAVSAVKILEAQIKQKEQDTDEQKAIDIRSGVGVQLNFPQRSHKLQVGGNLSIDPTFSAGTEFFQDGDILDQIQQVPVFGSQLSSILDTQLKKTPGKYLVLGLPLGKGYDVEYQLTFLPFKEKDLPLNLDKLQTSLTAQYRHLTGDGFTVNSGAIMFGINWPLGKQKKEEPKK